MKQNNILLKSAAVLSLAVTAAPLVATVVQPVTAFAAVTTNKIGSLTTAVGTASINKVQENASKAIEMDYSMELTVPKDVKSGDTINISTVNLGDFIKSGDTKVAVTIDGVEIGTLSRVESDNKRYEQNSPTTTLAQKKAANIEAGTQDNAYVLTFNSKASEYSSKKVTLKAAASLVYATTVNKDTTVTAQIFMNGNLLASKNYTLTATKPSPEVKSQRSALDYSRNTRMQVTETAEGKTAQNYLGMILLPLDKDYGVGSTIEVTLPENSMIKFAAAADYDASLALTHFPVLKDTSETNSNNVYLYDQSAVKLKAKSIADSKVVYEVTEGTLKRGDSYVGLPNQTGVNFVLTENAAAKLNKEGTSIGEETVTSVFKTANGESGQTQGNKLSIAINGAKIDAEGVKAIAQKKVTTQYLVESTKKELKAKVTDVTAKPKEEFKGYTFVKTETDKDGNVIHYYKENAKLVTTEWMYTNGEVLKAKVTGEKGLPKEDFKDAIFKETKVDKDGNTVHLYTKPVTPTEEVVTNHVDAKTGAVIKDQEKGDKPKADIKGYTFKETEKDDKGNVTHYYLKDEVKVETRFVDKDTNKEIKDKVEGEQPKAEITDYTFVETKKDESGNVTHYYTKVKTTTSTTTTTTTTATTTAESTTATTTTASTSATKKADTKPAVNTGAGVGSIIAPLGAVAASALAGVGAYFGLRKKDDE